MPVILMAILTWALLSQFRLSLLALILPGLFMSDTVGVPFWGALWLMCSVPPATLWRRNIILMMPAASWMRLAVLFMLVINNASALMLRCRAMAIWAAIWLN